jgi:hypothetical protein
MPLLVRVFFPSSAGETSEKEQEERPSSNLLPQAGEGLSQRLCAQAGTHEQRPFGAACGPHP